MKDKQLKFFDSGMGKALRDEGIRIVDNDANASWMARAEVAVVKICKTMARFTTDDVWMALHLDGIDPPPEGRAMGAVMMRAHREDLCSPTETTEETARPSNHRRPLRVWSSNILSSERTTP